VSLGLADVVLGVDCAVCRLVDVGAGCGEVDQVGNDSNTTIGHTCRFWIGVVWNVVLFCMDQEQNKQKNAECDSLAPKLATRFDVVCVFMLSLFVHSKIRFLRLL
jgi:hypothetical protein